MFAADRLIESVSAFFQKRKSVEELDLGDRSVKKTRRQLPTTGLAISSPISSTNSSGNSSVDSATRLDFI